MFSLLLVTAYGGAADAPIDTRAPETFAQLGADAVATILGHTWYAGGSSFYECTSGCPPRNSDWGTDSMVGALYERWLLTQDPVVAAAFANIVSGEPGITLRGASDVPMWDAVAAIRAYDVTNNPAALTHARNNYRALVQSNQYSLDPCRRLDYQIIHRGAGGVKTLETDANRVLAAVLLSKRASTSAEAQGELADATAMYAAVRRYFLDPQLPLYTVYVFATGGACRQVPRQFFASVNGIMIEAGLELAAATGNEQYARDARATGDAIALLSDARGVFADLQAQNDVVEPLVLGMVKLAASDPAARDWIIHNAHAAANARASDGSYGRFFDGPPPPANGRSAVFDTNGGLALMIAAASFAPDDRPESPSWGSGHVSTVGIHGAPSSYSFEGSGIALIGALPRPGSPDCKPLTIAPCEGGHVWVRIDGRTMTNQLGIWQGKALVSSAASVLFAWRWPTSGPHRLDFIVPPYNPKQGDTLIDVTEVIVLP